MAIYAIKAYDQTYCGLHGMFDIAVREYDSLESAKLDATQMSYEVMEDYGCIEEYLDDFVEQQECDREEAMAENVGYEIWKLLPDYHFTVSELDEMLNEDWDGTIENYFTFTG